MDWSIRGVAPGEYRVGDVFQGLENSHTLQTLYPEDGERKAVVRDTRLVVSTDDMYGYVDDADGAIYFGHEHLSKGERVVVYLDILHELVHVKQLKEGRDLYDKRYVYVDRPTEVEAYALVVEEARRLGMTDDAIAEYLYVEWASPQDHERLCRRLGVNKTNGPSTKK
ncbi:MAG TPA: hypothetical protein VGR51_05680 [Thermoplasmata archaeon]|jgi:hypothetical protein|nr:hypothetical protein [Thermoplasmata archaeon]